MYRPGGPRCNAGGRAATVTPGGPLVLYGARPTVTGLKNEAKQMSRKEAQVVSLETPVTEPTPTGAEAVPAAAAAGAAAVDITADVDGRRVRIVAQDEIVLECGQASITLRRNGRIIVRGTYVETHSDGTNRIKGGQVRIN